ncbi:hypothetical protein D9757_014940 [Collybiopsis confluens]|uniref:JmjC domain-containing protein n=1 Tax=Collybiopsis confluens TaxID=2823264 RepID=A0A8H5CKN8_9AGAR|nr:hypothetical protein D9757_014940 [Collybiopsis confluens]
MSTHVMRFALSIRLPCMGEVAERSRQLSVFPPPSSLASRISTAIPETAIVKPLCPVDELTLLQEGLERAWSRRENDPQWNRLIAVSNVEMLDSSSWTWPPHLGPLLGLRLHHVLSGKTRVQGVIPRSTMSAELKAGLERVAKIITENDGWPRILEDAFLARRNDRQKQQKNGITSESVNISGPSSTQNVSRKVAESVFHNLQHLNKTHQSKQFDNIISNIQLAAAYLSVMTLGVLDVTTDRDFPAILDQTVSDLNLDYKLSASLKQLDISLAEFQAPLFAALSVSPLLLFRTRLLQSSRFGRNHYISFMLMLGDIKPPSLRDLENLIWENLFLVSRRQLLPEALVDRVLDSIIDPSILQNLDNRALHEYFKAKFDPIRDYTGFFFPGIQVCFFFPSVFMNFPIHPDAGAVIKHEPTNAFFEMPQASFSGPGLSSSSINFPPTNSFSLSPEVISYYLELVKSSPTAISALGLLHPSLSTLGSSVIEHLYNRADVDSPRQRTFPATHLAVPLAASDNTVAVDSLVNELEQVPDDRNTASAQHKMVGNGCDPSPSSPMPQDVVPTAVVLPPSPASSTESSCSSLRSDAILDVRLPDTSHSMDSSHHSIDGMEVSCSCPEQSLPNTETPVPKPSIDHPPTLPRQILRFPVTRGANADNLRQSNDIPESPPPSQDRTHSTNSPSSISSSPPSSVSSHVLDVVELSWHSPVSGVDAIASPTSALSPLLSHPELTSRVLERVPGFPDDDVSQWLQSATGCPPLLPGPSDSGGDSHTDGVVHETAVSFNGSADSFSGSAGTDHLADVGPRTSSPNKSIMSPLASPMDTAIVISEDPSLLVSSSPTFSAFASDPPSCLPPGTCHPLYRLQQHSLGRTLDNLVDSEKGQRQSSRIAAAKRKLEGEAQATQAKRAKVTTKSKSKRRITKHSIEQDAKMDIDAVENDSVPRIVVNENVAPKLIFSSAIHVYSADHSRYFAYNGKHYSSEIADDLEKLAVHVDKVNNELGLPSGPCVEWTSECTTPITIMPPSCSTAAEEFPIYKAKYSDFYNMSPKKAQEIFRVYPVIVLSGRPTRLKCDLASLEEWGNVDEPRIMHDFSKYDPDNANAVFVYASYREFFQASKCLNSLDNPLSGGLPVPVQLSTDLRAAVTQYEQFLPDVPVRIMNWGLLAKENAVHPPHADRPGSCTWVAIEDGMKKWDLAFPPKDTAQEETASPFAYGLEMAENRNYARAWRWTSILLEPGNELIMAPGVVHSVTTLKDCVAVGGHFFSMPTMKYTLYSIFHTFVGSRTITNVNVDSEQQMLLRILLFWYKDMVEGDKAYLRRLKASDNDLIPHIPNVLEFGDFENLVMLLNYSELVLVLTPARYAPHSLLSFSQNLYGSPKQRGRAIRRWLVKNFELVLDPPFPDGLDNTNRLNRPMLQSLVGQAHTLWDSVARQEELGVMGSTFKQGRVEEEISPDRVLEAICQDLASFPGFATSWQEQLAKPVPNSYCWPAAPAGSRYAMRAKY